MRAASAPTAAFRFFARRAAGRRGPSASAARSNGSRVLMAAPGEASRGGHGGALADEGGEIDEEERVALEEHEAGDGARDEADRREGGEWWIELLGDAAVPMTWSTTSVRSTASS